MVQSIGRELYLRLLKIIKTYLSMTARQENMSIPSKLIGLQQHRLRKLCIQLESFLKMKQVIMRIIRM